MSSPSQISSKAQPPEHEDLRTVYQEVCNSYRFMDDLRAKLLGLLPLVSGAGIFFLLNEAFADANKRAFYTPFLLPIGLFGFVVTLGLFIYELHGIRRCRELIKVGKDIEEQIGIEGQFAHRYPQVTHFINTAVAAGAIYPAVLAAWTYVAFVFRWPQTALVIAASLVFLIGLACSLSLNLNE
jgi:hypothetical protein